MKFTAMTYNICSGRNMQKERNIDFAASVIRDVQPDFVNINEVRKHTSDVPINQADELGRLAGYYPVFGKSIDILGGEYGNAFLTRWPLVEWEVVQIPDRRDEEKANYEHRTVLRSVIEKDGKRLTVLGSHFGLAKVEHDAAVETVMSILEKEENPVILMGDFNMTPDNPKLKPIFEAMHDTADYTDDIKTFSSEDPKIKIDYILYTDPLKAHGLRTMDTQNSDHKPLIAEFTMD